MTGFDINSIRINKSSVRYDDRQAGCLNLLHGKKLKDWLSKMHDCFLDNQPFVVATACRYQGHSPEAPGVALFYSAKSTLRFTSSDFRYQKMRSTAADMLQNPTPYRVEKLALGEVAGADNGYCDVVYEYFDGQNYPPWLRALRTYRRDGIACVLVREFDANKDASDVHSTVHSDTDTESFRAVQNLLAGADYMLQENGSALSLVRIIKTDAICVAVVGNHPVADELQKQSSYLPIDVMKADGTPALVSEQLSRQLPQANMAIIMTMDHELDYQYCEALLKNRSGQNYFVGCIGSKKKAELFTQRLQQSGIASDTLEQFHMPIGVAEINGKQNSVIAASIIAQILMRHPW